MGYAALLLAVIHLVVFVVLHPQLFGEGPILSEQWEPLGWVFYIGGHLAMWGLTITCLTVELDRDERRRPITYDYGFQLSRVGTRLAFFFAGMLFTTSAWVRIDLWFRDPVRLAYTGLEWLFQWVVWFSIPQIYLVVVAMACYLCSRRRLHDQIRLGTFVGAFGGFGLPLAHLLLPFLTVASEAWLRGLTAVPTLLLALFSLYGLASSVFSGIREWGRFSRQAAVNRRHQRDREIQAREQAAAREKERIAEAERQRQAAEVKRQADERERQEDARRQHEFRLQELARRKAAEEQAARDAAAKQREQERFNKAYKVRCCSSCQKAYPEFVIAKCPWCSAESGQQLEAIYDALPPGGDDPAELPDLQTQFDQKEQLGDFVGAGNLFLDLALRLAPQHLWTAVTAAKRLVAAKYDIPPELEYGLPHRDRFLHTKGHRTPQDYGPQLIVSAYVLGATRRTLPAPHDRLLGYYLYLTDLQRQELETIVIAYARRPRGKTTYSPSDI